ncbi:protein-L-isoaspartate(D-aspartate) O-methyltransferase [Methylomarinovum caldicuralii]|uniref:Protein-L-isoaspartate O-methyltransferase n=1 Tax=Methylomarinovum caldicuralii TaxID=438856 RepID=A0AAU9C3S4_9GAMM|nr:protein-L-isoaspartate(D-aspartate) O-methyltransferase [Methylomarinovum caldicuralii]BCX81804.1 protein-L-isoaspartate(D-aspartate) O-methyltransferase [Methylomarinovum caldicuralii]
MSVCRDGIGMTSRRTRERMVARLRQQGIRSLEVLEAMQAVPRHLFVEEALASRAYEDTALPIGFGQTISQPYTVARMSELAAAGRRPRKVLEVGTGSGYQTAVLAHLADMVYTVERIEALQKRARFLLYDLKIYNVKYEYSDGGWGWDKHAPYDAIVVTAAAREIPDALLRQLAQGGVMVIPIEQAGGQVLTRVVHTPSGFELEEIEAVKFVPLLSGLG